MFTEVILHHSGVDYDRPHREHKCNYQSFDFMYDYEFNYEYSQNFLSRSIREGLQRLSLSSLAVSLSSLGWHAFYYACHQQTI